MKIIKSTVNYFKNLITNYNNKRITKELVKGARAKNSDRDNLRFLVLKFISKYRRKSKSNTSEYIPLSFEEKQKIKFLLYAAFGEQMQQLNLKLNNNLQLV